MKNILILNGIDSNAQILFPSQDARAVWLLAILREIATLRTTVPTAPVMNTLTSLAIVKSKNA
jgi:hypothetical protein